MDNRKQAFLGAWVATITPFGEDNEILLNTIRTQYQHLEKAGIKAIIPFSPTGEFPSLIYQEKVEILRTLGMEGGQMKIIPQIGHTSLKGVLRNLALAESAGVDGIAIIPPLFYPISQENLYVFLKEILEKSRLPVILYNMERTTQIPLSLELIEKLKDYKSLFGIVDESKDIHFIQSIKKLYPNIMLISGFDAHHIPSLDAGCDIILSELGNAYPWLFSKLIQYFRKGDHQKVSELQIKIKGLLDLLCKYPWPASLKYALYQIGFPSMVTRSPLDHLSQEKKTNLKSEIALYLGKTNILNLAGD